MPHHSPYQLMQMAVDIVGGSAHPSNKVAATLAGEDADGEPFRLSYTNYWPDSIRRAIGTDTRIGNSSGTIHAETACILQAPVTDGAALFVTDPPCPNCLKNIAEAGIRTLYIDHKGFEKDFAQRRGAAFESMSMRIARKAGISVLELFRKDQKLKPILEIPPGYAPAVENPPKILPLYDRETDEALFRDLTAQEHASYAGRPFALTLGRGAVGDIYMISTRDHPTIGYTSKTLEEPEGKYSFMLEPVNRLLMIAARYGLRIDGRFVYSARVPSARELVNMIGAELHMLHIGKPDEARDEHGLAALRQLTEAGILKVF